MIVATKDDCVHLSGSLVKNQWLFIKAAAVDLLTNHPQGIVIDCSELEHISEEGAKTFLDAMKDIQAAGARMIVSGLPENVLSVIRSVPGVRSQLPIAATIDAARASLKLTGAAQGVDSAAASGGGVVVPLLPGLDVEYAVELAARLARENRRTLHLVYLLEVARNLPLATPLPEKESEANSALETAMGLAKKHAMPGKPHVERVRDAGDGMLQLIQNYRAEDIVLTPFATDGDSVDFIQLAETLLRRATANVLIGRRAGNELPDSRPSFDTEF
jgi:anti-anti-sigma regulatory factor